MHGGVQPIFFGWGGYQGEKFFSQKNFKNSKISARSPIYFLLVYERYFLVGGCLEIFFKKGWVVSTAFSAFWV